MCLSDCRSRQASLPQAYRRTTAEITASEIGTRHIESAGFISFDGKLGLLTLPSYPQRQRRSIVLLRWRPKRLKKPEGDNGCAKPKHGWLRSWRRAACAPPARL